MWVARSTPGSDACVTMVPISHYFLLSSLFSGPADHRTLVFQLVASIYSTCVLRSVHYSNAPPTSNLFSLHRHPVLVGSKLKARSRCSVTSCEANGWSCIECCFERCSVCVVFHSRSRFLLDILSSFFHLFIRCYFFENITPTNRPIN